MSEEKVIKINELVAREKVSRLYGEILTWGTEEQTETGKRVMTVIMQDDTGQVKLKLWGDEIDKFKIGDRVCITKGYCMTYMEEKHVTAGKFGSIKNVTE